MTETGRKESKKEMEGKGKTFFSPSSSSLEGERSLSLPLDFFFPPSSLANTNRRPTWNVASSLTNAGSPLRLASTSFSERR